jgi:Domain of unknown function (DUF4357)
MDHGTFGGLGLPLNADVKPNGRTERRGLALTIHLLNGVPDGITTAEINHVWTGKLFLVPKSGLAEFRKNLQLRRCGVYFLVGEDPNDSRRNLVYVGASDDIATRLATHLRERLEWDRVVAVVSRDDSLNTAHSLWLEAKFHQLLQSSPRATITQQKPRGAKLSPSDQEGIESYVDYVQLLLPLFNLHFLEQRALFVPPPRIAQVTEEPLSPVELTLKNRKIAASAVLSGGKIVVRAGSQARAHTVQSMGTGYRELRQSLIDSGKLEPSGNGILRFTDDVDFESASAAAAVCLGKSAPGPLEWCLKGTKTSLRSYYESQLKPSAS